MTSLIKKAKKGNKEVFIRLYENNKQNVFYLSYLLLCDLDAADNACVQIFKNSWQLILDGRIESEREYRDVIIKKTVYYCKMKLSKGDTKAFKIPQNKNFFVNFASLDSVSGGDKCCRSLLEKLPALHRFIYVLDFYAEWAEEDIADIFHTNMETVKLALDVRQSNFDRFSYALKQEETDNIEKYVIEASVNVYEIKDGELIEFESAKIVAGDMLVMYTDEEDTVNIVV